MHDFTFVNYHNQIEYIYIYIYIYYTYTYTYTHTYIHTYIHTRLWLFVGSRSHTILVGTPRLRTYKCIKIFSMFPLYIDC